MLGIVDGTKWPTAPRSDLNGSFFGSRCSSGVGLLGSFLEPIDLDGTIHCRNVELVNVRLGLVKDRIN